MHTPTALYCLSLAQIDFRPSESTEVQTIRVDSIESIRHHFQPTLHSPGALYFLSLAQLDFRPSESTTGETIRVNSIQSSGFDNINRIKGRSIFQVSRKSTSGLANRHKSKRFVSIQQHFQPTMHTPRALYCLSLAQIDFRPSESTEVQTIRVDSTPFSTDPA